MNKLILPSSYDFGMPITSLVEVHSRGVDSNWMTKRAAMLTEAIAGLRPERGHTDLHIIAMGSYDRYGSNRNGDGFSKSAATYDVPEPCKCANCKASGSDTSRIIIPAGLRERHHTFVKNGNVYEHHKNKDPKKRLGVVKASAFNENMERVELLIRVNNEKFRQPLEKLAQGEDIPFSMAVRVSGDFCNICGHYATKRADYCDHAKNQLTSIMKSGHQVCVHNPPGVFFDISRVFRPADRIAWSLEKVASTGRVISSAELAEVAGVYTVPTIFSNNPRNAEKLAVLRKLANIEKEIEGIIPASENWEDLSSAFDSDCCGDIPEPTISKLQGYGLDNVMTGLRHANICLPLKEFFKLVMGSRFETVKGSMEAAKNSLPGVFNRILGSEDLDSFCGDQSYDGSESGIGMLSTGIKGLMHGMMSGHSLGRKPVSKRIMMISISGKPKSRLAKPMHIEKISANISGAEQLAREYAKYQLSFCTGCKENFTQGLTVLSNHVQ